MTLLSIVLSIPRNQQLPPIFMTTTSAANSSCKFNKRLKTTSASGLVQGERKSPDSSDDDGRELNHMKQLKAETKEVSTPNGGIIINSIVKEKMMIRYRECRKNHAASIGGYAVDGCHEFMPAGEEGTTAAFNCAACTCHRNFHKKEVENDCYCDCSSISAATTTK